MSFKAEQIARVPYLPDRIAKALKQGIIEGRIATGERLPSEIALAETYGVSLNVLREAIAQLRNEGIIESRQGRGAFVLRAPQPVLRLDEIDSLAAKDRHRSLFELRETLEVRAAELAAVRRSNDAMKKIRNAFDKMVKTMAWGRDGVEYDIDFHRTIAVAAGNSFMVGTISFIAEHLRESIKLTRANSVDGDVSGVTIAEHQAILDGIQNQDPDEAARAMGQHLRNAAERIGIYIDS